MNLMKTRPSWLIRLEELLIGRMHESRPENALSSSNESGRFNEIVIYVCQVWLIKKRRYIFNHIIL